MIKKALTRIALPAIAAMSFFSLSSFLEPRPGSCDYCQSAQYKGCRVTITYTDGTHQTYDCVNYRVPIAQQ